MYYKEFKDLTKIHAVRESEFYSLRQVKVKESNDLEKLMNPEFAGQLDQTVVVLTDLVKDEIVMSDSWMEQKTNIDFVNRAKGDVLIAGLGLGMIILAIQDKPEVTSVTVFEIDVRLGMFMQDTLFDHFNDKVKIIIGDINCYCENDMFDTIYCDIWNSTESDNFPEMEDLECTLSLNLKDGGNINHWRKRKCEEMWREENHLDEREEFY